MNLSIYSFKYDPDKFLTLKEMKGVHSSTIGKNVDGLENLNLYGLDFKDMKWIFHCKFVITI